MRCAKGYLSSQFSPFHYIFIWYIKNFASLMIFLVLSSLILSFSFSLNKIFLGTLDPFVAATIFCLSSAIFFFPFCRLKSLKLLDHILILLIGGIQFGLMYVCFQVSLSFLDAHEVALLMLSTPVYLILIDNMLFRTWTLLDIVESIAVAMMVIILTDFSKEFCFNWKGVIMTQLCNFSFALGQIFSKKFFQSRKIHNILPYLSVLYFGAGGVCFLSAVVFGNTSNLSYVGIQNYSFAVVYGIICCGLCHWLWNIGLLKVQTNTLAIMNNIQIPLAIIVSCVLFDERINFSKFIPSVIILTAMLSIAYRFKKIGRD